MPLVYRPWISPYGDDDFEWDRRKSLATFDDRDLVFEAARIVFRGSLFLATAARHAPSPAPDGGPFHGARRVVGRVIAIIYTPRGGKCRIISLRPASLVESEIYYEHTTR